MPGEEARALERIGKAALTVLDMVKAGRDAFRTAEPGPLAEAGLKVLMLAIQGELAALKGDAYRALRERMDEHAKASVSAREHLIELADGWQCSECKADVPASAAVKALPPRKLAVALVCKSCGASTPLAPQGDQAFARWFGHLVAPAWNPAANGFLWRP